MKKIAIILFTLSTLTSYSQNKTNEVDSLYAILNKAKNPSEKFNAWKELKEYYSYRGQADSNWYAA